MKQGLHRGKWIGGARLFEASAAILFFGALSQQVQLHQAGTAALTELAALGYQVPKAEDPLRVFPALTSGDFSARHAGGWRPGTIYLRQQPQGGFDASVYLRHEVFHEVSHRSCGGRLPAWAEEAGAMQFSGELAGQDFGEALDEAALPELKTHIRQGASLTAGDRNLLGRLVAQNGWPDTPCAVSPALQAKLAAASGDQGASGYVLISLPSGRILDSGGDQQSRQPPGSLLKLAYAAALEQANPEVLAEELATSDSQKLLQRRQQFQPQQYFRMLSVIKDQQLEATTSDWPAYLGARNSQGSFPIQASLPELALAMRAALLTRPEYFRGLSRNGSLPGSTLAGQAPADLAVLWQMQVLAKTGTVSTEQGQPAVGHLLLAWPAPHPQFLAVFRQAGSTGAGLLPKAAAWLRSWQKDFPPRFATARVRLLTATPPETWQTETDCPEISNGDYRFTVCGGYHIISSARGSRSVRKVDGVLYRTDGGPVVLETDSLSYADAVLAAEAQTLTGSARQAMRAVVIWNASHGDHRHGDSMSLCDTTHCMVFLGESIAAPMRRDRVIDSDLFVLLDKLADEQSLDWLPFSSGGDQRWQRQVTAAEIAAAFKEAQIWDIRRERRKDGEIYLRLFYPDNEEAISCEIFRNRLKLPSCPDAVLALEGQKSWLFHGLGAGHGLGLSIARAQSLASSGRNAGEILIDAYATPPTKQ